MKTTDEQDKMLNEYFKAYRKNIPDNGFAKRTINNLPKTESWVSKKDILITISLIIGVFFTIPCLSIINHIIMSLNLYTVMFIICCFTGIILSIIIAFDPESELI